MALPEANRLKRRQDFRAVYQRGHRYSSPHLVLWALKPGAGAQEEEAPSIRLGISVSQKVSKKAVERNRLKRQIRAALRELLPDLSPGWKVIVGVRPQAVGCKYERFLRELEQLLVKAEVFHGHSRTNLL